MASLKTLDTDIEQAKNERKEDGVPLSASAVLPPVSRSSQLVDGACICLNIASTVLLVFLNKWYVGPLSRGFFCRGIGYLEHPRNSY